EKPLVVKSAKYVEPYISQTVLFIGRRKDQKFISEIPPTVKENEKVTVFEALYDLDFIGNNEEAHHYELVDISKQFNGTAEKMKSLLRKRTIDGKENPKIGKSFSEWSREGRLIERYQPKTKPFYVRNFEGLQKGEKYFDILNN